MKVLMINVVCGVGSTGRICTDIALGLERVGHDIKIAYGREEVLKTYKKYAIKIGSSTDVLLHGIKSRIVDGAGFGSKRVTKRFIRWIQKYDPDVIHLHNIHGYYINLVELFEYLRTSNKKIIWTLHDCWAFTGHCVYFDYVMCDAWKTGCKKCIQKREYPICKGISQSRKNYERKKKSFTNIPNLTLVTPSKWLCELVKDSYLKDYPIKVIHNGVDCSVFYKRNSDLRKKYEIGKDKKIILGVASNWNKRKGLDYLIKLANLIDEQIVVIGISEEQRKILPPNMIGITRTNNINELAEWYSIADVFVNPTLEDNYPTTNLESIACGTPVVSFATGGSVESAEMYGMIVPKGDVNELYRAVQYVLEGKIKKKEILVSKEKMIEDYISLYRKL